MRAEVLDDQPSCSKKGGRPAKNFEDCSDRVKRFKAADLASQYTEEHLLMASKVSGGNVATPTYIPSSIVLAIMMDAELTKFQYECIKNGFKNQGYNFLPPYKKVAEEKAKCYPDDMQISEKDASVSLQSLLDHTIRRLFKSRSNEEVNAMTDTSCTLTSKWGCDGSSGHVEYNQNLSGDISDKNLLLVSMVPLSLQSTSGDEYWRNKSPSSTRYCRPISFEFAKETKEKVLSLVQKVNRDIATLKSTEIFACGRQFSVKHNLLFTMLDGKTAQTVTNTASSAVCYICKAKPSEMNQLATISRKAVDGEACKLGLSSLHARIKFMECILHIAYNKPFQKWSALIDEHKQLKQINKLRIQQQLKERMNLRVDSVQQGTGSSNDGNTSRRFFSNPALVADITGIKEELIDRFRIILQIITCGHKINSEKFKNYTWDTAKLFVETYPWYYMPVTVHKILIHGKDIMDAAILPIGMLSEEAEEARNKDYRKYRLMFSRKCSRVATNTDIFHRLLVSSDPFITSLRHEPSKQDLECDDVVKEMIDEE